MKLFLQSRLWFLYSHFSKGHRKVQPEWELSRVKERVKYRVHVQLETRDSWIDLICIKHTHLSNLYMFSSHAYGTCINILVNCVMNNLWKFVVKVINFSLPSLAALHVNIRCWYFATYCIYQIVLMLLRILRIDAGFYFIMYAFPVLCITFNARVYFSITSLRSMEYNVLTIHTMTQ